MKNTLGDLNNHLFAQLERLSDEELKGTHLKEEIQRAQAITKVSAQIINNGNLVLKAKELQMEYRNTDEKIPSILEAKDDYSKKK